MVHSQDVDTDSTTFYSANQNIPQVEMVQEDHVAGSCREDLTRKLAQALSGRGTVLNRHLRMLPAQGCWEVDAAQEGAEREGYDDADHVSRLAPGKTPLSTLMAATGSMDVFLTCRLMRVSRRGGVGLCGSRGDLSYPTRRMECPAGRQGAGAEGTSQRARTGAAHWVAELTSRPRRQVSGSVGWEVWQSRC